MAKINIAGSSIVLKSAVTLEALKKLTKYRPAALDLRDDKEKLLFKVGVAAEGKGSISDKAVYFAPVTHAEGGFATITLDIPANVKDAKDYAADLLANVFTQLTAMEKTILEASKSVDEDKAAMLEQISVQ